VLISGGKIKDGNVAKFSERECEKGSLGVLARGCDLMPKLMGILRELE
jgi:2,3-bisphosphoglycerate-independent phosphoglycerate mutase